MEEIEKELRKKLGVEKADKPAAEEEHGDGSDCEAEVKKIEGALNVVRTAKLT